MSTSGNNKCSSHEFVGRFVAICRTSNPRKISENLNISYQSAKNYLSGRFPEPKVLIRIADRTGVSIHWLLTGDGEKYIRQSAKLESERLAEVLSDLAEPRILRKMFEAVHEERVKSAIENFYESADASPRKIKIQANSILQEKQTADKTRPLIKKDR